MHNIYLSKTRLEAFSDAVFAIIMTLLVLELKTPIISNHSDSYLLMQKLMGLSPKYLVGAISFVSISVIWINHYNFFHHFEMVNNTILFLNVFLLLMVSFLPFPTAIIGDYPFNITSICLYGGTMFVIYSIFSLMKLYAIKDAKMIKENMLIENPNKMQYLKLVMTPLFYIITVFLSFISPYLSYIGFIALPILNVIPKYSNLQIEK